jgi:hypothetical protein
MLPYENNDTDSVHVRIQSILRAFGGARAVASE